MASQITMAPHAGFTTVGDLGWKNEDLVNPVHASDYAALVDIKALDAALAAANATYWTATRLMQESLWDKLYWLRVTRKGVSSVAGALI